MDRVGGGEPEREAQRVADRVAERVGHKQGERGGGGWGAEGRSVAESASQTSASGCHLVLARRRMRSFFSAGSASKVASRPAERFSSRDPVEGVEVDDDGDPMVTPPSINPSKKRLGALLEERIISRPKWTFRHGSSPRTGGPGRGGTQEERRRSLRWIDG